MKDSKLKSKNFFNASADPLITYKSTKISQNGPNAFDVAGIFTIRGVSRPETLTLTATREGAAAAQIKGQMAFDRRDYGMTSGIPFIKIADRVQVNVDLQVKRVSGPPLDLKNQPPLVVLRHRKSRPHFSTYTRQLTADRVDRAPHSLRFRQ